MMAIYQVNPLTYNDVWKTSCVFKLKSAMTSLRRSQVNPLSVNDFFHQLRKKTKKYFSFFFN